MRICLLIALTGAGLVQAQEFRASIIGQVTDPSGAPVPQAVVTAVEHSTQQTYTTRTNTAGVYSIDYMTPGQFTVTVEAQGFSKEVYSNVTLESAQKLNLNAKLTVGQVNQEVTVTASPGLINTATASSGGVLDQTKVENMPSMGLYVFYDLAFVQGVMSTGTNEFNTTPRNSTTPAFSVNGAPTNANRYFVNGAPVSTTANPDFVPSQHATQEVQASVSAYDAAAGPGAGGVFTSVVKSGANRFHGELYDFVGNQIFNANDWSSNENGIPRGVDTRNTYGGTIGGPIRKNKTFFFASIEGFEQDQPGPVSDSVPTPAMRVLSHTR